MKTRGDLTRKENFCTGSDAEVKNSFIQRKPLNIHFVLFENVINCKKYKFK